MLAAVIAQSRFPLGEVVSTPGALALANPEQLAELLAHHAAGDWGEVCPEDAASNEAALTHGGRLLSVYTVNHQRLWIITEADRSVTTFLLPSEY